MEIGKSDSLKSDCLTFFRQNTLACVLFINIVFAGVFFWVNDIRYGNDDMVMCWIASGCFLGQPDSHLVFSNFIYGLLLVSFYTLFPAIEWYSMFLIALDVLAISIVQREILRLTCSRFIKTIVVFAIVIVEIKLLRSLTFTTTAGILATSSFILICKRNGKSYFIGVLLFVLAAFVRFSSAMLVGVMFLSFYPIHIYRHGFSKKEFFALSLCVFLGVAFQFVDRQYYKLDSGWDYYYETNKARAGINDHVDVWRIKSDMPDDIIESDIDLLYLYGIRDSVIFNNESLMKLHDIMNKQTCYNSIPYIRKIKHVPFHLKDYLSYWLAVLPLVIVGLVLEKGNRKRLLLCSIPVVVLPLITSIVSMELIVKERAFLCAYIPFLVFFYAICLDDIVSSKKQAVWLGFAIVFSVLPMLRFKAFAKERNTDKNLNVANYIQENQFLPLFVEWPFDGNVMSVSKDYYDLSSNGWTYNMPGRNQIDKFTDLVYDEKLVIVGNNNNDEFFKLLEETICFHYGVHVQPFVLKEIGDIVIYKLIEINDGTF